jgi:hypothetical protein
MPKTWMPREMRIAPRLDVAFRPTALAGRRALLVNPFYPKDPHASFGKHVLTPSLALISGSSREPSFSLSTLNSIRGAVSPSLAERDES